MNLYDQLLEAIESAERSFPVNANVRRGAAAKACQTISEEWAKGYLNWVENSGWVRSEKYRWSNGESGIVKITDDELIQLYKTQTENQSTSPRSKAELDDFGN